MNLNWIYIAISWVLLRWHQLWSLLLPTSSGITWILSIIFLVLTIRGILFPLFVKQIKSQRAMQALQPQVKELQKKHKGDRDTLQKELMELYRREKTNPLMGCLPLLLQAPVFIGLFHVLRHIDPANSKYRTAMINIYHWSAAQFQSASEAKIFGAPIAASFSSSKTKLESLGAADSGVTVKVVTALLIATMVITMYLSQRQMISRTPASDPQQAMIQKLMLYGAPISLLVSGVLFPIGVVFYWTTSNLFSVGQQLWVLRKMPPPGTGATKNDKPLLTQSDVSALAPKPGVKPVKSKKNTKGTPKLRKDI